MAWRLHLWDIQDLEPGGEESVNLINNVSSPPVVRTFCDAITNNFRFYNQNFSWLHTHKTLSDGW